MTGRETPTCEPYITQDDYDSGQTLICDAHGTDEPVMVDGRQTYQVTLPMLTALVAEHHTRFAPARKATP